MAQARRQPRTSLAPAAATPEYLTTREAARLLRLNQKKIYALLAHGQLPASRISGKWLFPRVLLEQWVNENTTYPRTGLMGGLLDQLTVVQGSDDWALGRALDRLREQADWPVVSATVGSLAGFSALAGGRAHLAGFHLSQAKLAEALHRSGDCYLIDLAIREQGLVFRGGDRRRVRDLRSVVEQSLRFACRQQAAGTYQLAERLFAEAGADLAALPRTEPLHSHLEVGLAVRSGAADVGLAIRLAAEQCQLEFLPLQLESYRLAVPAAYFGHPRMVRFLDRLLGELRVLAREQVPGYGFETLGRVTPAAEQLPVATQPPSATVAAAAPPGRAAKRAARPARSRAAGTSDKQQGDKRH